MWKAFGELHPFLVHFPVALILVALVAEALFVVKLERRYAHAARFMILAAAWVAVPSALAGFAEASGHLFAGAEADAFSIHRIAGIATPVLAFLAAGMAASSERSGQIWELFLYRIFLCAAAVSVVVAGYQGAIIAHG